MAILQQRKSSSLLYIEECIQDIQTGGNVSKNLKSIKKTLNRMYSDDVECEDILISEKNYNKKFFGMLLFPTEMEMQRIQKVLLPKLTDYGSDIKIDKKVLNIKKYVIEMDWKLIFDKSLRMTAGEITAILLHEIGHLVFTDRPFRELKKYITLDVIKYGLGVGTISSAIIAGSPIVAPIMSVLIINMFINTSKLIISSSSEKDADTYAVHLGYGLELHSAMSKFLSISKSEFRNFSYRDYVDDTRVITKWTLENIIHFEKRAEDVANMLKIESENSSSIYLSDYLKNANIRMMQYVKDKKLMILKENSINSFEDTKILVLTEGITLFKRQPNKISRRDIDELRIQMQDVRDIDDKLYLLELITIVREKVKIAIEYIDINNGVNTKYRNIPDLKTLKEIDKELSDMQETLVNMKVSNNYIFGLNVKYPKGYEG